jgi:hypothetical protein
MGTVKDAREPQSACCTLSTAGNLVRVALTRPGDAFRVRRGTNTRARRRRAGRCYPAGYRRADAVSDIEYILYLVPSLYHINEKRLLRPLSRASRGLSSRVIRRQKPLAEAKRLA